MRGTRFGGPAAFQADLSAVVDGGGCDSLKSICREDSRL